MNKEAKAFAAISKWNMPPYVYAAQKYQKFIIESGMNVKNSFMRKKAWDQQKQDFFKGEIQWGQRENNLK